MYTAVTPDCGVGTLGHLVVKVPILGPLFAIAICAVIYYSPSPETGLCLDGSQPIVRVSMMDDAGAQQEDVWCATPEDEARPVLRDDPNYSWDVQLLLGTP